MLEGTAPDEPEGLNRIAGEQYGGTGTRQIVPHLRPRLGAHKYSDCALRDGICRMQAAIHVFARDTHKQATGHDVTRVGGCTLHHHVVVACDQRDAAPLDDVPQRNPHAARLVPSTSRATWRSSNGVTTPATS